MPKLITKVVVPLTVLIIGIVALEFSTRHRAASDSGPVKVGFCYLAEHRQMYWDRRVVTTADIWVGVEHSELTDTECPDTYVPFNISLETPEFEQDIQNLHGPFDPPVRASFEAELKLGSASMDRYYRVLRAVGIKTPYPGILVIRRVTQVDRRPHF